MDKAFSPERLQEAMAGMSNVDLAEKLGCARSNITMYLSGQRTPSKMTIQLMAICLGVNPAWLAGFNVPKYLEKLTIISNGELLEEINRRPLLRQLVESLARLDDEKLKAFITLSGAPVDQQEQ